MTIMNVSPGRPEARRDKRQEAILLAATDLFLFKGFDSTSLADVVARAGGSLATLYALFRNKEGLLDAVIERGRSEASRPFDLLSERIESARDTLIRLAQSYHSWATSDRAIAFTRLISSRCLQDPEFGQRFFRDAYRHNERALAETFARLAEQGRAQFDDPTEAARLFTSMVLCDAHVGGMLGVIEETRPETIAWRLEPFMSYFKISD